MTDANTITILRQQRDDAWAEYDRLRDRLADYERDLIDKDTGKDRSRDTDWLRAGFLQRGAEIDRIEDERDDHEQARTALEEALAQTAAELREYQRNTIRRDESVPHDAIAWHKADEFCHWIHCGPIRWEIAEPGQVQPAPAPIVDTSEARDLRPDDPGPITLPIVDVTPWPTSYP